MNVEETSFIGKGWTFPPAFAKGGNAVLMNSPEDEIEQSLNILLGTRLNERVLKPDFGMNLNRFVFAEVTQSLFTEIKSLVKNGIEEFEPRIELESINVDLDDANDTRILIEVQYSMPGSNSRKNLVYPFYINESNVV